MEDHRRKGVFAMRATRKGLQRLLAVTMSLSLTMGLLPATALARDRADLELTVGETGTLTGQIGDGGHTWVVTQGEGVVELEENGAEALLTALETGEATLVHTYELLEPAAAEEASPEAPAAVEIPRDPIPGALLGEEMEEPVEPEPVEDTEPVEAGSPTAAGDPAELPPSEGETEPAEDRLPTEDPTPGESLGAVEAADPSEIVEPAEDAAPVEDTRPAEDETPVEVLVLQEAAPAEEAQAPAEPVAAPVLVPYTETFRVVVHAAVKAISGEGIQIEGQEGAFETLQEAIGAAGAGDTIRLFTDVTESVTLDKALTFDLNGRTWTGAGAPNLTSQDHTVTILGAGGTMAAAEGCRAVELADADLTLRDLTITKAEGTTTGGGVSASLSGTNAISCTNVTFRGNAGSDGGALYVTGSGSTSLAVTGCEFLDNDFSPSGSGVTGALYSQGTRTIDLRDSSFDGNTGCAALYIEGGIGKTSIENVSVRNTTLTGIYGAVTMRNKNSNAGNIEFSHVTVTGNSGPAAQGAGMFFERVAASQAFSGRISLEDCAVTENRGTLGGGIYVKDCQGLYLTNVTAAENRATEIGGGLYLYWVKETVLSGDSVIRGNRAGRCGGGIFGHASKSGAINSSSSFTLKVAPEVKIYSNSNDDVHSNLATQIAIGGAKVGSSTGSEQYPQQAQENAKIISISSTEPGDGLNGRVAEAGDGVKYTLTEVEGQVLMFDGPGVGQVSCYYIVGYGEEEYRPAVFYLDPTSSAGDHGADNERVYTTPKEALEAVKNYNATNADQVQRIYVCAPYAMNDAEVEQMAAINNGGIAWVRCRHNTGNMFTLAPGATATLNGAHIDGDHVPAGSAMLHVSNGQTLNIRGTTIIENGRNALGPEDGRKGGGIYVNGGRLNMLGGTIQKCEATDGGGIYAYGAEGANAGLTFTGGLLTRNIARGYDNAGGGGGLFATVIDVKMELPEGVDRDSAVCFLENEACMGGGVYLTDATQEGNGRYEIYNAHFIGNKSTRAPIGYFCGGGLYADTMTTVYMRNVFVTDNKTDSYSEGCAVASCPTGQLALYDIDGAFVAHNRSRGTDDGRSFDVGVIKAQVFNLPHSAYVSSWALGGGENHFTNEKGEPAPSAYYQYTQHVEEESGSGYFQIKANPSTETEAIARKNATVFFTGNSCTRYGSAIMTNGTLIIGAPTKALRVEKVWAGDDGAPRPDEILVQLQYEDAAGAWVSVSTETRSDARQVLNAGNGWAAVWSKLGEEQDWRAVEANVDGYETTVGEVQRSDAFAAIQADKYYVQTITNTRDEDKTYGSLTVEKTAQDLPEGEAYPFTIRLEGLGEDTQLLAYRVDGGPLQGLPVNGGRAALALSLCAGEQVELTGLPTGTAYTVAEAPGGYTTYVDGRPGREAAGTVTADSLHPAHTYHNVAQGELSITKTVTGAGDTTRAWTFQVALTAPEGLLLAESYPYTVGEEARTLTLESGRGTLTLTHGQTAVITGLPQGTGYTVTEGEADRDGYQTTTVYSDGERIIGGAADRVTVTNYLAGGTPTPPPTPTPSEEPTPSPIPTQRPDRPDREDRDEEPRPSPTPVPTPEVTDLPDGPVPQGPGPAGPDEPQVQPSLLPEDPMEELPDEEVPLAGVPDTGDNSLLWLLLAALSGAGLLILGRKRREEE